LPAPRSVLEDLRSGFTIGAITFERAKRWKVRGRRWHDAAFVPTDVGYAFPVGATTPGRGDVHRPVCAAAVHRLRQSTLPAAGREDRGDPKQRFTEMTGVSCPLYLNTRPKAVIKLTKS
jgi:hypothetical protein